MIVTTNMFGDILSDEASELSGSLGLGGSLNARRRRSPSRRPSTARPPTSPARASPIPTSLILSAAMLLDWRGRRDGNAAADRRAAAIEAAVEQVLDNPADPHRATSAARSAPTQFADARVSAILRRRT